jgi:hypothetical protein
MILIVMLEPRFDCGCLGRILRPSIPTGVFDVAGMFVVPAVSI